MNFYVIRKKLFDVKRNFIHRESFFDIMFYIFNKFKKKISGKILNKYSWKNTNALLR